MVTIDLQRRVSALENTQEILRLKARYWRFMDRKQYDDLLKCFAEDAVADFPREGLIYGSAPIVAQIRSATESLVTMHHGHNGDIVLSSETSAKGTWAMQDRLYDPAVNSMRMGYGFYEDDFAKINGAWKILRIKLTRIFSPHIKIEN